MGSLLDIVNLQQAAKFCIFLIAGKIDDFNAEVVAGTHRTRCLEGEQWFRCGRFTANDYDCEQNRNAQKSGFELTHSLIRSQMLLFLLITE